MGDMFIDTSSHQFQAAAQYRGEQFSWDMVNLIAASEHEAQDIQDETVTSKQHLTV